MFEAVGADEPSPKGVTWGIRKNPEKNTKVLLLAKDGSIDK